jgi:uncharacterized protein with ParB-like and HNH nuclease domain
VLDEAEELTEETIPVRYDITSYGADFLVDGLVKRLNEGDIFIPSFQRNFIWTITDSSRFIESLLLGLPVPGIFLSKAAENKYLVVDGQQRLQTLRAFYKGVFRGKEFKLQNVDPAFANRTYAELGESDRRKLDNSVIHATIVQQNEPSDDDSSIYNIFERLNAGGRRLYPQEIRASIFHGPFNDLLNELNEDSAWRALYGQKSERLKDVELILRFLALYFDLNSYAKPMKTFLSRFMKANEELQKYSARECADRFLPTINAIASFLGDRAFKPTKAFNAAVFDCVAVGLAVRLDHGPIVSGEQLNAAYDRLLKTPDFIQAYSRATSNTDSVQTRMKLAKEAFLTVE